MFDLGLAGTGAARIPACWQHPFPDSHGCLPLELALAGGSNSPGPPVILKPFKIQAFAAQFNSRVAALSRRSLADIRRPLEAGLSKINKFSFKIILMVKNCIFCYGGGKNK
jgi:hypothetical protein